MVKVVMIQGRGTSHDPAIVEIYEDDKLVKKISADVKDEEGADGGYYPTVKLAEVPVI